MESMLRCGRGAGGLCCVREEEGSAVGDLMQARAAAEAAHAAYMEKYAAMWGDDTCDTASECAFGLDVKRPQVSGKREEGSAPRKLRVTVHRASTKEPLGVHLKHVDRKLVVVGVLSDGAVQRAVTLSRARGGDTLEPGDTIVQINSACESDAAMVQECKERANLVFHALRCGASQSSDQSASEQGDR